MSSFHKNMWFLTFNRPPCIIFSFRKSGSTKLFIHGRSVSIQNVMVRVDWPKFWIHPVVWRFHHRHIQKVSKRNNYSNKICRHVLCLSLYQISLSKCNSSWVVSLNYMIILTSTACHVRDKSFSGWGCQPHAHPQAILKGRCFLSGFAV
jgi:hypothetical protein